MAGTLCAPCDVPTRRLGVSLLVPLPVFYSLEGMMPVDCKHLGGNAVQLGHLSRFPLRLLASVRGPLLHLLKPTGAHHEDVPCRVFAVIGQRVMGCAKASSQQREDVIELLV